MNENLTIGELLKLFPGGFTVGPNGSINKTLLASTWFAAIAENYPIPPSNGGYLVVEGLSTEEISDMGKTIGTIRPKEVVVKQASDNILFIRTSSNDAFLAIQEEAKKYGRFYPSTTHSPHSLYVDLEWDVSEVKSQLEQVV